MEIEYCFEKYERFTSKRKIDNKDLWCRWYDSPISSFDGDYYRDLVDETIDLNKQYIISNIKSVTKNKRYCSYVVWVQKLQVFEHEINMRFMIQIQIFSTFHEIQNKIKYQSIDVSDIHGEEQKYMILNIPRKSKFLKELRQNCDKLFNELWLNNILIAFL